MSTINIGNDYLVRLHNGQCAYGSWMTAIEAGPDIAEHVACLVLEDGIESGRFNIGGQEYVFKAAE
jgi:hypothetical protein